VADDRAVSTADLIVRHVDATATTLLGIMPTVGPVVHNSIAALALTGIVHGRFAALGA